MIKLRIFTKRRIKLERELLWNRLTLKIEKLIVPIVKIFILKIKVRATPINDKIFFNNFGKIRFTIETIIGIITAKNK